MTRSVAAVPVPQPVPGVESVLPANGAVVGVAHPVVVTFTAPVADRAAAERSIRVISPGNLTGHFEWVENDVVQWVPKPLLGPASCPPSSRGYRAWAPASKPVTHY